MQRGLIGRYLLSTSWKESSSRKQEEGTQSFRYEFFEHVYRYGIEIDRGTDIIPLQRSHIPGVFYDTI